MHVYEVLGLVLPPSKPGVVLHALKSNRRDGDRGVESKVIFSCAVDVRLVF